MVRTQIQLTEAQAEAVGRLAAETGESMSALIREALDRMVSAQPSARKRALKAIGVGHSGLGDVSLRHDQYLSDAFSN